MSRLMCGNVNTFDPGSCPNDGWLSIANIAPPGGPPATFDITASSEVMVIGFSNGGGCATYSSWSHGEKVTKALAIDYHAQHYQQWITHSALPADAGKNLALKIYYSCESTWFTTDMITGGSAQFDQEATPPLGAWTFTQPMYGGLPYYEFLFSGSGGQYLKFAVHGLDSADPDANCGSNQVPGATDNDIHMNMPFYVDWWDEIDEWVAQPLPPPAAPPVIFPSPSPPAPTCYHAHLCCPMNFKCTLPTGSYSVFQDQSLLPWVCMDKHGNIAPPMNCKDIKTPFIEKKRKRSFCRKGPGPEDPEADVDLGAVDEFLERLRPDDPCFQTYKMMGKTGTREIKHAAETMSKTIHELAAKGDQVNAEFQKKPEEESDEAVE